MKNPGCEGMSDIENNGYQLEQADSSSHYQLLLCRTLRVTSDGDLLITIHSMIVVAADRAYLGRKVNTDVITNLLPRRLGLTT